jgi:hypothetical protein
VPIAGNAGIGSPPLPVFPTEILNHTRLEFLLQVNLMVGNVQNATDILRPVCLVLGAVGIPEAHMYADYFIVGFFK